MNESKAKKLRQLVRHLQDKGIIQEPAWKKYSEEPKMSSRPAMVGGRLEMAPCWTGQLRLDPNCGRAVYQKMKDNAERNGR